MSQFNLTPMSIIDNTALGGFRAGMADERNLLHSDSSLETERLAQEQAMLQNEMTRLKRPYEIADLAKKQAQAEADLGLIKSGDYARGQKADIDLKIANAVKQMDENERKKLQDKMDAVFRINEMIKDKTPAYLQANWPDIVKEADAQGIKNFPKTWTPDVAAKMDARARLAWRTTQVVANEAAATTANQRAQEAATLLHTRGMEKEQFQQRAMDERSRLDRNARSADAAANRAAQIRVAEIGAEKSKVGMTLENARAKMAAVENGEMDPANLSEVEIALVEADIMRTNNPEKNILFKIETLKNEAGKAADPRLREAKIEEANELKRSLLGAVGQELEALRQKVRAAKEKRGSAPGVGSPENTLGYESTNKPAPAPSATKGLSPGSPEHKTDWLARAKKLNPSLSDAEIEAKYRAKYGK